MHNVFQHARFCGQICVAFRVCIKKRGENSPDIPPIRENRSVTGGKQNISLWRIEEERGMLD
jgi:hypothetical protein